jgi:hypothetical protein
MGPYGVVVRMHLEQTGAEAAEQHGHLLYIPVRIYGVCRWPVVVDMYRYRKKLPVVD